jgi:hypothetical protein
VDPPVYLDDIELAAMDNKRFFSVWVEPGLHRLNAGGGHTQSCEVQLSGDFEAGKVYYVKVDIVGLSCFMINPRNPVVGQSDVSKLKPLSATDVRHPAVRLQ